MTAVTLSIPLVSFIDIPNVRQETYYIREAVRSSIDTPSVSLPVPPASFYKRVMMSIPVKFATDSAVLVSKSNQIAMKAETSLPLLKEHMKPTGPRIAHITVAKSVDFVHSLLSLACTTLSISTLPGQPKCLSELPKCPF